MNMYVYMYVFVNMICELGMNDFGSHSEKNVSFWDLFFRDGFHFSNDFVYLLSWVYFGVEAGLHIYLGFWNDLIFFLIFRGFEIHIVTIYIYIYLEI